MHAAALPLPVTLAVLAAAVTHATWNAIAHGIKDQLLAFGLIGAGGILVAIPLVILSPFPLSACWPYLLASIVIHVFYNLLLMRSYRYGEFGQVYPLARGTSPLVVTVLAAVFAAERPSVAQVAGVLVVSCGLVLLVLAGRRAAARGGLLAVPARVGRDSRLLQPAADAVLPAGRIRPGLPAGPGHLPAGGD
ncbi:EamA family transporter, partial [Trebonia sp.]|uniref:EamA family transporter n=1 Tax=Trebonia sp. TaxID=2767075 RepID=UPI003CC6DC42